MYNQPFLAIFEENLAEFFFENNWEYFSKIFLKAMSDFGGILFLFLGKSFLPPERKRIF